MPAFRTRSRGFTLIEIMITVAILAIVASLALPSYRRYVERSKLPAALDVLTVTAAKMELLYQDRNDNTYGTAGGTCLVGTLPTVANFSITCTTPTVSTFLVQAAGTGSNAGYRYTINQAGTRATPEHPLGVNNACWTTKGGTACDH